MPGFSNGLPVSMPLIALVFGVPPSGGLSRVNAELQTRGSWAGCPAKAKSSEGLFFKPGLEHF
jgi:hypothetical protein